MDNGNGTDYDNVSDNVSHMRKREGGKRSKKSSLNAFYGKASSKSRSRSGMREQ